MSLILGALGGAADATLKSMDFERDAERRQQELRLQSQLDTDKAKTLAQFAEQLKSAPLQRLQGRAQSLAQSQVPVDAEPVRSLSGVYASDQGPSNGGFSGDRGVIQSAISQLPAGSDRDAALAQYRQQVGQAGAANSAAVAGQTRSRTPDEAFDAALEEAKVNDLQAYAAGKPLSREKTVTVAEGAAVIDPKTGKVIYSGGDTKADREREREDRRDARASAAEEARDARQQRAIEARERLAEMKQGGADSKLGKEERLRYTSLFNDAGRQMRGIQDTISRLRRDPLYSMAKKGTPQYEELEDLRKQRAEYEEDRKRYGSLLANGGEVPESTPATSPSSSSGAVVKEARPPLSTFVR